MKLSVLGTDQDGDDKKPLSLLVPNINYDIT